MTKKHPTNTRIWNVAEIDEIYYEPGNKSRNHKRVHETFIEPLFSISENSTSNYRRIIKNNTKHVDKPSDYIVATLHLLGPMQICAQMGIRMPKPDEYTFEALSDFFARAAERKKEFDKMKKKPTDKKTPVK